MDSNRLWRHLHRLLVCPSPKQVALALSAALLLLSWPPLAAGQTDSTPGDDGTYAYAQIRLYNFRHASQLATQLAGLFPVLSLSSAASSTTTDVPDDMLVATPKDNPPNAAVPKSIGELKRVVALLDLPRPQVTLQVWSLKVSSKDPKEIDESVKRLHQEIDDRNFRIQKALKFGWYKLMATAQQDPNFFNPEFREYISNAFVIDDAHRPQRYSLGYIHAFSPDQPSIATMLLCLAASDNPQQWTNQMVDEMEAPKGDPKSPRFTNFRTYLLTLVDPGGAQGNSVGQQAALRAALADFLFQYKWATVYPHDFVGYDLQNSATVLDSLFAPGVDALNRDIATYEKEIVDGEQELAQRSGKIQLASRGIITVAALSGQQAIVQGKTVSFFDVTKPPTLSEMVKGMSDAKTNLSALFPQVTGNPALVAAALAAVSAQEKTFVQIEKGMNLVITPTTLATAASAELNINLDGGDDKGDAINEADPKLTGGETGPDLCSGQNRQAFRTNQGAGGLSEAIRSFYLLLRPDASAARWRGSGDRPGVAGGVWRRTGCREAVHVAQDSGYFGKPQRDHR
jgi:hypothetical protein